MKTGSLLQALGAANVGQAISFKYDPRMQTNLPASLHQMLSLENERAGTSKGRVCSFTAP